MRRAKQETIAKRYQQDDFATMVASGSWFKIVAGFSPLRAKITVHFRNLNEKPLSKMRRAKQETIAKRYQQDDFVTTAGLPARGLKPRSAR